MHGPRRRLAIRNGHVIRNGVVYIPSAERPGCTWSRLALVAVGCAIMGMSALAILNGGNRDAVSDWLRPLCIDLNYVQVARVGTVDTGAVWLLATWAIDVLYIVLAVESRRGTTSGGPPRFNVIVLWLGHESATTPSATSRRAS